MPSTGPGCSPQYGPGVLAAAAELTCAHYLPVGRAAALMATLAGIAVSVGFIAGVRGRTARLLETASLPRVRELLGRVEVLHVDETVRHEAPCDRVEVRGLHRRAVAAAG